MPQPDLFAFESSEEYWAKSGKQAQTWSGSDVRVVFTLPTTSPAFNPGSSFLESVQLQTITMSSASSLFPVRRCGEAKAQDYTKGTRTFAGSMVFSIIGEDPLQRLFSIDALRSSMRTDDSWHIDQMPPLDCILLFSNEFGANGIQVIQGIQFSNWGQTVSIDDMYLESTYSYIADHITPFLSYNEFAPSKTTENAILSKISSIIKQNSIQESTPDEALAKMSREFSKQQINEYGEYMVSLLADLFDNYNASHSSMSTEDLSSTLAGAISQNPAGSVGVIQLNAGPEIPPSALLTTYPLI